MTGELEGLVAIVTGATGGIGRATCTLLASRGARVVPVDLDESAVAELAQELGGSGIAVDAATADGARRYVEHAVSTFGTIDILVNHAGVQKVGAITEMPPEDFDLHWRVNVGSVFLGMQAVLPVLYAKGSGAVVNTASALGFVGARDNGAYVASKHAVIGLTKVAAMEAGPHGVRVNAVAPGPIDTPMLRRWVDDDGLQRMAVAEIPVQRVGLATDVANTVGFLVGPASGFVSGETVRTDGGLLAGRLT